jgi:5-methylcytosine-specific restriction endonuclease McrA
MDLTVDHIIPLSEAPELVREELNLRVICRGHNAQRGTKCSDEERNAVYAAIKARRERRARAYRRHG